MTKKIVIASGKGGTGKTTIATGLQYTAPKHFKGTTVLIDFDVEEPNDHLFFREAQLSKSVAIMQPVPEIDTAKCTFCGKCKDICAFNAITLIKAANYTNISKDLCHSCGACLVVCKDNALTEIMHPIGEVNEFSIDNKVVLKEGRLDVGVPHQTALIRKLKKEHIPQTDLAIFDAPPGTSCPVVNTVEGADLIIVVGEPSPFGLNDMKLLIEILKDIGTPFAVVINKDGIGNEEMAKYLKTENIDIISKIPFSEDIAREYSKADIAQLATHVKMSETLKQIWAYIDKKVFKEQLVNN